MHYELRIFPGLVPNDRHQIEDLIDEHLAELGVEVCGGGGLLDGSQSDIAFIASNIESAREVVKLTQNLESSSRFELYSSDSNSVIDTFEPSTLQKKWWQFWKL